MTVKPRWFVSPTLQTPKLRPCVLFKAPPSANSAGDSWRWVSASTQKVGTMAGVTNSPDPHVVEGEVRLSPLRWAEALFALEIFHAPFFDDLREDRRVTVILSGRTITVRYGSSGRGDVLVVADTDDAVIRHGRFGRKPALRLSLQRRTIQHPSGAIRIRLQPTDLARVQRLLSSGPPAVE